jgi:hypothetical protein
MILLQPGGYKLLQTSDLQELYMQAETEITVSLNKITLSDYIAFI